MAAQPATRGARTSRAHTLVVVRTPRHTHTRARPRALAARGVAARACVGSGETPGRFYSKRLCARLYLHKSAHVLRPARSGARTGSTESQNHGRVAPSNTTHARTCPGPDSLCPSGAPRQSSSWVWCLRKAKTRESGAVCIDVRSAAASCGRARQPRCGRAGCAAYESHVLSLRWHLVYLDPLRELVLGLSGGEFGLHLHAHKEFGCQIPLSLKRECILCDANDLKAMRMITPCTCRRASSSQGWQGCAWP